MHVFHYFTSQTHILITNCRASCHIYIKSRFVFQTRKKESSNLLKDFESQENPKAINSFLTLVSHQYLQNLHCRCHLATIFVICVQKCVPQILNINERFRFFSCAFDDTMIDIFCVKSYFYLT